MKGDSIIWIENNKIMKQMAFCGNKADYAGSLKHVVNLLVT